MIQRGKILYTVENITLANYRMINVPTVTYMTNRRSVPICKIFGLVIVTMLLLGVVTPSILSTGGSDLEMESSSPDDFFPSDIIGDTWYIDENETLEGSVDRNIFSLDANIQINSTGTLFIKDASLILLIDGYHPWRITVMGGGDLVLLNGTISTSLRDDTLLRPFLKTNITAYQDSSITLLQNSSFKFPGWVYLEGATLTMRESSFDPLEYVPDFDYTWGVSDKSLGIEDNNDCPRLIANEGSHVLMESSQINNQYTNLNLGSMFWEPEEITGDYDITPEGDYIIEPQGNIQVDVWELINQKFPAPDIYPYLNPFDRVSALYLQVVYRTGANYTTNDGVYYETPYEVKEAFTLENQGAFSPEGDNIYETSINQFGFDEDRFIKNLTVTLSNSEDSGETDTEIYIRTIQLYSAFDNDIHIWDSTMTVIDSVVDIDFNPSDVDPRPGVTQPTDDATWMANANQNHRVIRLLSDSHLRGYGLQPTDVDPQPDGDPIVVTDESSKVEIYRWATITPRDKTGTPISGVLLNYTRGVDTYNNPANNLEAWDYLNRTYNVIYDTATGHYVTDERGETVMFLLSDNITHPNDWPNSEFTGEYKLRALYEDEEGGVDKNVTERSISLPAFPNLKEEANHIELDMEFDMEIPHPDLAIEEDDIVFLVEGHEVSYVTVGTNVTIQVTVHNIGTLEANDILVHYYKPGEGPDDVLPPDLTLIGSSTIDNIQEGESEDTSVIWAPESFGSKEIYVHVDPHGDIIELNETNNIASKVLTVGEKANLVVDEIFFDPSAEVINGTDVYIAAEVANIGGTDVYDVNVSFYHDTEYIDTRIIDHLPGNMTFMMTEPIHWDYPGPGEYDITVIIDPNEEQDEQDRENNELTRTINILTEPDLLPEDFYLSHEEIYDGEVLTIATKVRNQGEWPSQETGVTFYVDWGTETENLIGTVYVPAVGAGMVSDELSIEWEAKLIESELSEFRTITVIVNEPPLEDREVIRENNYANQTVEILNPAHLSVMPEDITFSTELSQVNQPMEIFAEVYNTGGEDVEVTVRFFVGETVIGDDVINVVSQGSSTAVMPWTPTTRGNHEITVIVDPDEEVHEVDRRFNEATVIKPIFSENYEYDLIVNDDNTPVTRGEYKSPGFVVVEEGGELFVRGDRERVAFDMTQTRDNQFSIIVRDQGRLVIDNAMIFSEYHLSILVMGSGSVEIVNSSITYEMVKIDAQDSANVHVQGSSIRGAVSMVSGSLNTFSSEFTSTDIHISPDEIHAVNTTFEGNLDDFHNTVGSLTAVETGAIGMTGDSSIEILRWLEIKTVSNSSIPVGGTVVSISSLITDYTVTGTSNPEGVVYLAALTDILTPDETTFVGNYEITAHYAENVENYTYGPEQIALPNYPSPQHVIEITLRFEDLRIPDLAVFDGEFQSNITAVTAGRRVRFTVTVHNLGMADAEDVNVRFYLIGEDEDELIGTYNINRISSMENQTATIQWTATMTDEDIREEIKQVRVWVDPDVLPLTDPNLGNNEAFTQITIRSPPRPEFDLTDIIIRAEGRPIEDDTVLERDDLDISVHIINLGGTILRNASIEFDFDHDGFIARNVTDMPVDHVLNVTETWTIDVTGEVTISVTINTTYDNMVLTRTIFVEEMAMRFLDVSVPLEAKDMGETITILGDLVRDIDDKPLRGMTVFAYLIDENGNVVAQGEEITGEDGSFLISLVTPDRGGDYRVRLTPDHPRGEEAEYTSHSFEVIDPAEGIPLWMIALIIIIVVAGSLVGMILYLKYKGEGEWVECGECGSTIPAESNNCPKCGTVFEMDTVKCSECGEWISADTPECPHCGVVFITTGEEVEDYSESMRKQYAKYVKKNRRWAEKDLGKRLTREEFLGWWKEQPSYLTFDEWLEQEEARRKKGGVECPQCGALNSVDDALCQKCGTTLVQFTPSRKMAAEPDEDIQLLDLDDIEKMGDEEEPEEEPEEEEPPKRVGKTVKKRPKRVAKKVKKKVVNKPEEE